MLNLLNLDRGIGIQSILSIATRDCEQQAPLEANGHNAELRIIRRESESDAFASPCVGIVGDRMDRMPRVKGSSNSA